MGNGQLACASCHGPDGSGGEHGMGQMQVMFAPDIRWSAIGEEFDAELFILAVTKGEDRGWFAIEYGYAALEYG